MNLHLTILIVYSLALMALGLWIGRRVRGAGDFFVAGRRLGPGLIFSTMLAGFAIAAYIAFDYLGGVADVVRDAPDDYFRLLRLGSPGLSTLAILVPPFIVSPGLLQKIFGARD